MINLLILYDTEGFAYFRRAMALQKYSPEDFAVMVAPWPRVLSSGFDTSQFDCVLQLDFSQRKRFGAMPHVLSYNADSNRRQDWWGPCRAACDFMIVNNRDAYLAHGRQQGTCNISNGLDTDEFQCLSPIEQRPERVFWVGSSNPTKCKGYELLCEAEPRLKELGFIPAFYPVPSASEAPFSETEEIVRQYNQSAYIVSMSRSEGTPGTSLEGMACGCALVSTNVGNVREFGVSGENCILIDRSVDGLIDGLLMARERRVAIATNGMRLMHDHWSYGEPGRRAEKFFNLFRRIVRDGPASITPFSYDELE